MKAAEGVRALLFNIDRRFRNGIAEMIRTEVETARELHVYVPATHIEPPTPPAN